MMRRDTLMQSQVKEQIGALNNPSNFFGVWYNGKGMEKFDGEEGDDRL
jgi:hypothetical protein